MAAVVLIGKNKVLEYMATYPESQIAFLTFLKEFAYYAPKSISGSPIMGTINVSQNYVVEYKMNPFLNAACILWLGNTKEHTLYIAEKQKRYAETTNAKVITISIKRGNGPIKPKSSKLQDAGPEIANIKTVTGTTITNSPALDEGAIESLRDYDEYEASLKRAISILAARPETPEFIELRLLISLIKTYEAARFNFPKLNLLDAIKLKMEHRGIPPDIFVPLLKKKENVDLFFSGKRVPAKGYLQKICARVGIKFPITDDDFRSLLWHSDQ